MRDGANATRVIDGENAMKPTGPGSAAAQQAAHASEQQPPTQFRSESGRLPSCVHWTCCNDAGVAAVSDSCEAA